MPDPESQEPVPAARRLPWIIGAALLLAFAGALLAYRTCGAARESDIRRGALDEMHQTLEQVRTRELAPEPEPDRRARVVHPLALFTAQVARDPAATAGRLEGLVRSRASGEPIAGAELDFVHAGATTSVRSAPDGTFSFTPAESGEHALAVVTADGFLPFAPELTESRAVFRASPSEVVRGLLIELEPVAPIVITVHNPDGQPVAGAMVARLDEPRGEQRLAPLDDAATTDAAGEARLVAPEGSVIEARHERFSVGRAAVDSAAAAARRLEVRLARLPESGAYAHRIMGRVLDARSVPIAGARVVAVPVPSNPALPSSRLLVERVAETGPDGAFAIVGLSSDAHSVFAIDPDTEQRSDPLLTPSDATDVVLRLVSSAILSGSVRDADTGAPIAAFTVVVSRADGLTRTDFARTAVLDGSGRFVLRGLSPGEVLVTVVAASHAPRVDIRATLAADRAAHVDVLLSAGVTVRGRVVEERGARPIAGADVVVEGRTADAASIVPVERRARTDARGEFALAGLDEGVSSLRASAPGHHSRIVQVTIAAGRVEPVEIPLSPVASGEASRIDLVGIGCVLAARGEVLVVGEVVPGGGAAAAGIAPGDEISTIDGEPVAGLGFGGSIERIRGAEGTVVMLAVARPPDAPRLLTVQRRRVSR